MGPAGSRNIAFDMVFIDQSPLLGVAPFGRFSSFISPSTFAGHLRRQGSPGVSKVAPSVVQGVPKSVGRRPKVSQKGSGDSVGAPMLAINASKVSPKQEKWKALLFLGAKVYQTSLKVCDIG